MEVWKESGILEIAALVTQKERASRSGECGRMAGTTKSHLRLLSLNFGPPSLCDHAVFASSVQQPRQRNGQGKQLDSSFVRSNGAGAMLSEANIRKHGIFSG